MINDNDNGINEENVIMILINIEEWQMTMLMMVWY